MVCFSAAVIDFPGDQCALPENAENGFLSIGNEIRSGNPQFSEIKKILPFRPRPATPQEPAQPLAAAGVYFDVKA